MRNTEDGLIYEVSEADYKFGADDKIEIPENTNTVKHFYNQRTKRNPKTNRSCGLFGSMGCVSDLTGYEYTEEDIKRINQSAIDDYGLSIPGGMTMKDAVDCVRNDWNTQNPTMKISSYRSFIGDKVFSEALKKGHSLAVGYRTSQEYYDDSQIDAVIDGEDFPKNGGHLVRTNFKENIKIDDNYKGSKKYNEYINNKIKILKDNGVFFPSAYLFLYDKTMEDKIKDNIDLDRAKTMYELGYWNGLEPRKEMSRQEVMTVIHRVLEDKGLI